MAGRRAWRGRTGLGLAPERVVLNASRAPTRGDQHEKTGRVGEDFVVREGGHRFLVNLEAYLDTGLFLDHSEHRRAMVAAEAAEKALPQPLLLHGPASRSYRGEGGSADSVSVDLRIPTSTGRGGTST